MRSPARCADGPAIRDTMESRIFVQAAQTLNKPCLGIGRGLQLFNVLLGGTLYQNLPTQLISSRGVVHNQAPPYREPAHALHLDTQSPLYALAEQVQIQVNSSHHQESRAGGGPDPYGAGQRRTD